MEAVEAKEPPHRIVDQGIFDVCVSRPDTLKYPPKIQQDGVVNIAQVRAMPHFSKSGT